MVLAETWTVADGEYMRQLFASQTWGKLKQAMHGVLVSQILSGKANNDFRVGFLTCLGRMEEWQRPEPQKDEDRETDTGNP
jgi:hypothetical protein